MNWLFYGLGYLGLLIYVVVGAIEKDGRQFSALTTYVVDNALALIVNILAYNAIVALWMWSNALEFFGLEAGKLDGMTILLGYAAQSLFTKAARQLTDKAGIPPTQ